MTELELTIRHLKEAISVGNVLLKKLEIQQKDLKKSKEPNFPYRFIAVKDKHFNETDEFIIGLQKAEREFLNRWEELPPDFMGRACFTKYEIQEIILGLQTLLGDQ